MPNYTFNDKNKIIENIDKIKENMNKTNNNKILYDIFNIITKYNIKYTNNSNGIYIRFHNLQDEVYDEIVNILANYSYEEKDEIRSYQPYIHDDLDEMQMTHRLSNLEKNILRKKKYEDASTSEDITYSSFNVSEKIVK